MNFNKIFDLVETLRKGSIGVPTLNRDSRAYEFHEHSPKVVAVLKLMRAAHGLKSAEVLRVGGHFFDMGMITRGVFDSVEEIYFLLEEFPKASNHVDKFVKAFFESTIDGHLTATTEEVRRSKIRSARVRYLKNAHDQKTQDMLERIFKIFSGYVHAKYAHIMEVYGGPHRRFNLSGIPSAEQKASYAEHIKLMASSILHAAHFISDKLELREIQREIFEFTEDGQS